MSNIEVGAIPKDKLSQTMQLLPADYAKGSSVVAVTTTAQNITIPTKATIISIQSNGAVAFVKFAGGETDDTATNANFDEFVGDGMRVDRQLPSECINEGTISIVGEGATSCIILFF